MDGPIEFVFSFRSPYVWIAARHVLPMLRPATEVRWTPFLPLPSFTNFGRMVPGKVLHNRSVSTQTPPQQRSCR